MTSITATPMASVTPLRITTRRRLLRGRILLLVCSTTALFLPVHLLLILSVSMPAVVLGQTASVSASSSILKEDDKPEEDPETTVSPAPTAAEYTPVQYREAVDFRDFLLDPSESLEMGGSGLQPYGDVFHLFLWPAIEEMATDEAMTQGVMADVTMEQSGIPGSLVYNASVEIKQGIDGALFELRTGPVSIDHLDQLFAVELLVPTTEPHVLATELEITNLTMRTTLEAVFNGTSPLDMNNTFLFEMVVPKATLYVELLVLMDAIKLWNFPVSNILEIPCWMDILMNTTDKAHDAVELHSFNIELSSVIFSVECLSCEASVQEYLPQLLGILQRSIDKTDMDTTNDSDTPISNTTLDTGSNTIVTDSVELLIKDAAFNAWDAVDLAVVLEGVTQLCPTNSNYDPHRNTSHASAPFGLDLAVFTESIINSTMQNNPQVVLSRPSFEAIIAAGYVGAQSGAILGAIQYITEHPEDTFQPAVFQPKPNAQYINWTNLAAFPLLQGVFSAIDAVDPEFVNERLGGNGVVSDGEVGDYSIDISNVTQPFDTKTGHVVALDQLIIHGVDTIANISLLEPITPYQLRTEVFWEDVKFDIILRIQSSPDGIVLDSYPPETISFSIAMTDALAWIDIWFPVNLDTLGRIPLGGVLQNELRCLVAAAEDVSITNLNLTIGTLTTPRVSGTYIHPELQDLVNEISYNFEQNFAADVTEAIPIIFQTTLRSALNKAIYDYTSAEENCTVTVPQPPGFVDFQELFWQESPYGRFFTDIYKYFNETFFNKEGVAQINQLIAGATNKTEKVNSTGTIEILDEVGINFTAPVLIGRWSAAVGVQVANISVLNVDSMGEPFRILWPETPYELNTNISFGVNNTDTNQSKALGVGADIVMIARDAKNMNIHNRFKIRFSIADITIFVQAILKILEDHFLYFPLEAAVHLSCWLVLLPPQRPSTFTNNSAEPGFTLNGSFNYSAVNLDLTCTECTSTKLTAMIKDIYRLGEDSSDSLSELINLVVKGEALGDLVNQAIAEAKAQCPSDPSTWGAAFNGTASCGPENTAPPSFLAKETGFANRTGSNCGAGGLEETILSAGSEPKLKQAGQSKRDRNAEFFNYAFLSFSVLTVVAFGVAKIRVYYRARAWTKNLPYSGKQFLRYIENKERERDAYLDETMPALSQSLFVPPIVRVLVPVVLVVNILLFVVAHVGISTVISLEVNFGGDHFLIDEIFAFNFMDGLRSTFENGGYEMAIMLLIFGGVWPYFICGLSLVLWFTPPRYLSSRLRGRLFLWIDAMNKLTVNDILKFMVIIAIFFMYAGGPYIFNQSEGELYSLVILAWPGSAMYAGSIAITISRETSRFLLDFHYMAINGARDAFHKEQVVDISKEAAEGKKHSDDSDDESEEPSLEKPMPEKLAREKKAGIKKTTSGGNSSKTSRHDRKDASKQQEESETSKTPTDDSSDASTQDTTDQRAIHICGRRVLLGTVGIFLGAVAVLILLVTGLVFFPALSIDLSSILELFLESGTTYEQAISEFGAYAFICAVLIKASLAVESKTDYAAVVILGVLLLITISGVGCYFFFKYVSDVSMNWKRLIFSEQFLNERKKRKKENKLTMMPTYLRLKATHYSSVYVMSYVIGIYQLGAVTIYMIHYFCNFLDSIYEALSFVGIITSTSGQCWEAQMGQIHNVIVFFGCFIYLTIMFMQQVFQQRQLNIAEARKFLLQVQKEKAWTQEARELQSRKPGGERRTGGASKTIEKDLMDALGELDYDSDEEVEDDHIEKDHDRDGMYFADHRFSFADPRYSFNLQFRQSVLVRSELVSTVAALKHFKLSKFGDSVQRSARNVIGGGRRRGGRLAHPSQDDSDNSDVLDISDSDDNSDSRDKSRSLSKGEAWHLDSFDDGNEGSTGMDADAVMDTSINAPRSSVARSRRGAVMKSDDIRYSLASISNQLENGLFGGSDASSIDGSDANSIGGSDADFIGVNGADSFSGGHSPSSTPSAGKMDGSIDIEC